MLRSVTVFAGVLLLGSFSSIRAVVISVNPTPGTFLSGGWNGNYYADSSDPGSIASAQSFISGNSPAASFLATSIDYGVNDSTTQTVSAFFGTHISGLNPSSAGSNLVNGAILDVKGYIHVTSVASPLTFTLSSDDGSDLFIAGTLVVGDDGEHGGGFVTPVSVTFTQGVGFYPIELIYFENFNDGANLGLAGSGFTGATSCTLCNASLPGGVQLTSSADLFTLATGTTPEPTSLGLVTGLIALVLITRRK